MIQQERLVKLFKELCLINAPALQERECVVYVRRLLETMGLEVVEDNAGQELSGNANNVIATLKGNIPGAKRIFFSAHFDTVEPTAGLKIVEEDGILRSSGNTILGADDKSGMAAIIEAIQCLKESGEAHGDIVLLFSVAEEIGLRGASVLPIEDLNLDYGYVLDTGPPVGSFVTRTATHDRLYVTIHGKPAHSGKDPEKGINAIQVLADAVHGMKLGRIGPETTANLGVVSGGTADNVVCAKVVVRGEARSTDEATLNAQVDHMITCFNAAAERWGATLEIDHDRHYHAYTVPDDAEVVTIAQHAARTLGFDPVLRTTLGGSDANIFNAKGVPSIVMATGMEQIHTHQEHVSIESLVQNAQLVLEIVRSVASQAG